MLAHHLHTLGNLLPVLDGLLGAELLLHVGQLVLEPVHLETVNMLKHVGDYIFGTSPPRDGQYV